MTQIVLIIVTVLVGVTAEFLVSSINGLVESNPALSAEWVGLILLPIVGNAAEHFTAVSVSVKDKLDLSISVAVCLFSDRSLAYGHCGRRREGFS